MIYREKCAGIELTIENGESFACVYSPGSGIGGDVFIYDHKQWADNTDTAIDGNGKWTIFILLFLSEFSN